MVYAKPAAPVKERSEMLVFVAAWFKDEVMRFGNRGASV